MNSYLFLENIFNNYKNINIVLLGDTTNKEKFAYKIKSEIIKNGYQVSCVDKELNNINQYGKDIDLLILCMNPFKSINFLKECKYKINNLLIQPNAYSDDIIDFLDKKNINYEHGCILQYLKLNNKKINS